MGIRIGLICGDQLSRNNPVLNALERGRDVIVMGESVAETRYVWHHVKKLVLVLSAMRHHAEWLRGQGWHVDYRHIDDDPPADGFTGLVADLCRRQQVDEIVVTRPGEWRVLNEIRSWQTSISVPVRLLEDTRFFSSPDGFMRWAQDRKTLRMEFFYRAMRRETGYLMDGDQPVGGHWNYDADNRRVWKGEPPVPEPMSFAPDRTTRAVIELVDSCLDGFGESADFDYPVTRNQARRALRHFIDRALPEFGDFQDAMHSAHDYLFHSRLSAALNIGLLDPREVCDAAEQAWRDGRAPLNAVEGFIRQIIGWREFIRGVYWREMPDYARRNRLGNRKSLPRWYWTGQTRMNCLRSIIDATRRNGYAHHIQRLMVTGNFALLLGVRPTEICDWYLAVYVDAFDWVELPNTLGMVMHADGGLLGSKPYAASGKYIRRMSNYCDDCPYSVANTVSDDACPFNALYWDFLIGHRGRFEGNPRMKMMYRNVDRMDPSRRSAIRRRARWIRQQAERL